MIHLVGTLDLPAVHGALVDHGVHLVPRGLSFRLCRQHRLALPAIRGGAGEVPAAGNAISGHKEVAARRTTVCLIRLVGFEDFATGRTEDCIFLAAQSQHTVAVQSDLLPTGFAGHHFDPANVDDVGRTAARGATGPVQSADASPHRLIQLSEGVPQSLRALRLLDGCFHRPPGDRVDVAAHHLAAQAQRLEDGRASAHEGIEDDLAAEVGVLVVVIPGVLFW